MASFVVVDLETTGLPGKPPGWEPRVVEVGAVVVADGALVAPPEEHLRDPRAAEALRINGLTPDEILARGVPEDEAADRLVRWMVRVTGESAPGWLRAVAGTLAERPRVHWVIAGGESGPHARPSNPDWFRSLRDQCQESGAAFFFKQWGAWAPCSDGSLRVRKSSKRAGRLLDGVEWSQVPEAGR